MGYEIGEDELFDKICEDTDIYKKSSGGVTFSGGEPLLQHEFLTAMLKKCKEKNIHTAIETAMCVNWETAKKPLILSALIFCDIKAINDEKHKKATGASNRLILENIQRLSQMNKKIVIRVPVIPGFSEDEIEKIAEFVKKLPNVCDVELLAFHSICAGKYKSLNRKFEAEDIKTPTSDQLKKLYEYFV